MSGGESPGVRADERARIIDPAKSWGCCLRDRMSGVVLGWRRTEWFASRSESRSRLQPNIRYLFREAP